MSFCWAEGGNQKGAGTTGNTTKVGADLESIDSSFVLSGARDLGGRVTQKNRKQERRTSAWGCLWVASRPPNQVAQSEGSGRAKELVR